MIYGKISSSFELLTEETAIKWRLPVPAAKNDTFTAGRVCNLSSSTGKVIAPALANMAARSAGGAMMLTSMLFDNYTSSIDDSQGSGYVTGVLGRHIGRTSQVVTSATAGYATPGLPLYSNTSGQLTSDSPGTALPCAYLINYDGTFATYYWIAE